MATLAEVKVEARRLDQKGEPLRALRLYDAALAAAPQDLDARIKVGDYLDALGNRAEAIEVYRAAARFAIRAGHPLAAVVAVRLVEAAGSKADDLLDELVATYAAGSPQIAEIAARVSPPSPRTIITTPDLLSPAPASFAEDAARRAVRCTDSWATYPEAVHAINFLSELSPDSFRRVLGALLVKRLPDGAPVIREGDEGASFFLVGRGEVRVTRSTGNGTAVELSRLREGALFGEMALLGAQPRSASVWVVDEADLLEVSREALAGIAGELAQVAKTLDRFMRTRLLRNLVATSPIFRPFARAQKLDLLRRFTAHEVAAGASIVQQGEAGRGLFVMWTGEATVSMQHDDGSVSQLATLRAGELFGQVATTRGKPAMASVVATKPSTVLFLARDYFQRLVAAFPEIETYFERLSDDRAMSTRLKVADNEIVEADVEVPL